MRTTPVKLMGPDDDDDDDDGNDDGDDSIHGKPAPAVP